MKSSITAVKVCSAESNGSRPKGPVTDAVVEGGAAGSGEQLCRACGLCCDGTLFDLVKLEQGDDAGKLKTLGLPVSMSRGKMPVARFPQPCSALCKDRTCQLYAERPWQCRTFECRLFKDAKAGRTTFAAAVPLVKHARRRADNVRRLLRELGDTDEHRALGERFHRTSERMESGNADEAAKSKFADLSLAVHRLKLLLHDRFYTQNEARSEGSSPSLTAAETPSKNEPSGKIRVRR
jgi:Fe-S-cluster containining protein